MIRNLLIAVLLLQGCSRFDPRDPIVAGLIGGGAGALGGYKLSPNIESRSLNVGVFGALTGMAGYLGARYLWAKDTAPTEPVTLENRERNYRLNQELVLPATEQKLPDFLEKRLTPLVLEQWVEKDSVAPDGSLNEPHRVWRIKRSPQLIPAKP
ncbi:MAG: hypothetical protein EOP06_28715 [Proteobacteria bacterium]|nr:MAG: hypothetical protein EOP06_28715 [Pseudomonadota bacterium]